tara:strand:+ start:635 stop:2284 length:1650 start_codon:yes stop_codon:yes gene_type:complete
MKNIKFLFLPLSLLLSLLFFSNGFWLYLAYQNKSFPYYELGKNYLKLERSLKLIIDGENQYSKNVIKEQLDKMRQSESESSIEKIETHLLPIKKLIEFIPNSLNFALKGGSIAPTQKGVLVLDRLGKIFYYEDAHIRSTKLIVPNNLNKYISSYSGDKINFTVDSLRAHSIEYDKKNSIVYVAYSEFLEKDSTRVSVSSIHVSNDDFSPISDWVKIYETEIYSDLASNTSGAGGKILLNDDILYLTVGNNYKKIIEDEIYISNDDQKSSSGKIIQINLINGESEIISQGHRNSQGLVVLNNGFMINSEHGPQGGDELNLIEKGNNYGYPYRTFGTDYGSYTFNPPKETNYIDFVDPIFDFSPGIGISGLIEIDGFHEKWNGNILLGSLKGRSLYRMVRSKKNFISLEPIWIGSRIRDLITLKDTIVLLTDNGELITLSVDQERYKSNIRFDNQIDNISSISACLGCHSMTKSTPNSSAPSLHKIFNRKIGSDTFLYYSDAIKNIDDKWTRENLIQYLSSPSKFIPGTSKVSLGLADSEIKKIVDVFLLQ